MEREKGFEEINVEDLENGAVVIFQTRMFGGLLEVPWEGKKIKRWAEILEEKGGRRKMRLTKEGEKIMAEIIVVEEGKRRETIE